MQSRVIKKVTYSVQSHSHCTTDYLCPNVCTRLAWFLTSKQTKLQVRYSNVPLQTQMQYIVGQNYGLLTSC